MGASSSNKDLKLNRKKQIQQTLRKKNWITVDIVKQRSGTKNTGNVARAFFSKYEDDSEIISIDRDIIKRLYVLLQVISSKSKVCLNLFKNYCLETTRKCVQMYG